ncbi:MAG: phenylalanine--tRNA ligase subunit beta [Candidatus Marinimicrobia bacterium]|nr:phenylalanine--tRNA ligase subunit beta [Candidatus Neomarinimicrobiota bacterium]MDP6936690.1 phenylalanine--tRNA ligase subunit beta [Candidatus Neomarinimicrobiota bacterium]
MKVSQNWLKEYIHISDTPGEVADYLTALGLEASYEVKGKNFTNVVLGRVESCNPHPDADKLSVCEVDTGSGELNQIVCGAPNVKAGIHVPVAQVGAEFNGGDFKIKKAKLRGVESNGMICSGKELAYNDDHEGILILDTDAELGTPIENILNFEEDVLFELDLTPNRGDCLSHIGVARDLAALTKQKIKSQDIQIQEISSKVSEVVSVSIEDKDACPRYAARVVKGVKVGPSPSWLVQKLEAVGLSSINNVVDAANFVLMDKGHPMHTFDLAEIEDQKIKVRYAKEGESFTTLDGVKHKLSNFHLLICDGKKPVALAGIMGGENSEISESTTDVLIESAYFNPTVVRKGAKTLDLSTDASRRFERDTDMDNVIQSINQLAGLIQKVAGGEILQGIVDEYPDQKDSTTILFSPEYCRNLLGIDISDEDIQSIFSSLQIQSRIKNGKMECTIPLFRNDLEREVDLCEEIARVYGYDNIPSSQKYSASYAAFTEDDQELDSLLRTHLQSCGFHEHYSNSLFGESFTSHFAGGEAVELHNPLSRDMAYMRNSILPGLLMAADYNEKRQEKGFNLFEIGAIHNTNTKTETGSKEKFQLGLLWYGEPALHWRKYEDRDLFHCKGEIEKLLATCGISQISFKPANAQGFTIALKIYSRKTQIGVLGIPENSILKQYDLKRAPIIADLSLHSLRDLWKNRKQSYTSPPQFPATSRDIALQVNREIPAEALLMTIKKDGGDHLKKVSLFDVYQPTDVGETQKSLAFSLQFQSESATLIDAEVDSVMSKILDSLQKAHGAVQR